MYAMLTGTLPFTVEPFSLRALYQKMVDKEMNPLPTQLSAGKVPAAVTPGFQDLCAYPIWSVHETSIYFTEMVSGLFLGLNSDSGVVEFPKAKPLFVSPWSFSSRL